MRMADGLVRNFSARGVFAGNTTTISRIDMLGVKLAGNVTSDVHDPYCVVRLQNCDLASATEFEGKTVATDYATPSGKHDQTAGNHLLTFYGGTIISATDQRHTASGLSWKFRPTITDRGEYLPLVMPVAKLAVASGVAVSVTIWTRRDSTNIKGRLRVRGGQLGGVPEKTIVCEPTINTWTQSSAITFTPTEDGVVELEFAVFDGTGTTNNFWIDDLTVA
jgi:hypothetical protein